MKIELISHSPSETVRIGEKIGKLLKKGSILGLTGNLGAGKTTMIQGIARGLGVDKKQYVRSPSFTLAHQYKGKLPVYHLDLYRLNTKEINSLGYEEYVFGDGVCIIEWIEKMGKVPMEEWLHINLKFLKKEEHRKITVNAKGKYEKLIKELAKIVKPSRPTCQLLAKASRRKC
ncbi:MAG: tRNA (adenosine(37)-N6)-threonylcarbamoyltransferase complex ATPase subunit type 1 TsaE [Candidatus Ratteibacteria bacterium]|nr:tRNA (adenosine(37)-N6)-threonylcarbamoyltransferase complex ATPase subunit type 1 TsaE [Candidatus Ratteibacteria bacterium]